MAASLSSLPMHGLSTWSSLTSAMYHTPSGLLFPRGSCRPFHHTREDVDHVLPQVSCSSGERYGSICASPFPAGPSAVSGPQYSYTHGGSVCRLASQSYLPVFDWLGDCQQRPSQYIVEKTCEMICYLWFSSLPSSSSPSKRNCPDPQQPQPYFPHSSSSTASLQFSVSPAFVRFMQKVLETTQVSQSVIVLSLHYIYRMKARNRFTTGQAGSEYRVALAALMMANKFVDDNTYTNKTWAEVSGIGLAEVNKMEREFLLGIDFGLYVDETTYDSWLNLLKGLTMAKERESQHWHRSRWRARPTPLSKAQFHRSTSMYSPTSHSTSHRARSSSPSRRSAGCKFPCSEPHKQHNVPYVSSSLSGLKRTAADAFCLAPTPRLPASNSVPRVNGLRLEIPQPDLSTREKPSLSEPLQLLSKLSLGASPVDGEVVPTWASSAMQETVPQTLVSAYRVDERIQHAPPQNLYFYTLACSPMEERNSRKARLHYHQPPAPIPTVHHIHAPVPMMVQSASASPCDVHRHLPPAPVLPPFSEFSREPPSSYGVDLANQPPADQGRAYTLQDHSIPSAPFANAGPPGYQFYFNSSPDAPFALYRPRGRRL
ncbi:cyclin-domain-containing protein [Sparassis latifolia]